MLYIHTARYLRAVQIYTRFRPRPRSWASKSSLKPRRVTGRWAQAIPRESAQTGQDSFRFLNQERKISSWNDPSISKLWQYNLHYFEHVSEPLVQRWIAENPAAKGVGWEPYPTSLRISNWCKWILNGASPSADVYRSIGVQAAYLEKRLELHLLANHLLANAKALIFAGSVLEDTCADRWRSKGIQILQQELPRQILADGAHVERSPMYHCIILEDLLDICNLARAFDGLLPDFSDYARRMLGWLDRMVHADGRISFFNDAGFGVAPEHHVLVSYALRLGLRALPVSLSESGYIRLQNDNVVVLFDAAPIGPDYQPGHGHSDTLSFEVSCRGRRILVNSGTSTYDLGLERDAQRGTAAHNTLRLDGLDQSEMWGSFRVARRAHPFDVRTDHHSFAEAAHNGYHRLRPQITHRRRVELIKNSLRITDSVQGTGHHTVELFYHFAPHESPVIQLDPKMVRETISTTYHTGFNLSVPNTTVIGKWFGPCPISFETRINLIPDAPPCSEAPSQTIVGCAQPFGVLKQSRS